MNKKEILTINPTKKFLLFAFILIAILLIPNRLRAEGSLEVLPGADLVSRYIWRGLMINDAPNVQPSVTFGISGFEFGLWGSSTLAKTNTVEDNYAFSHEVDFWLGYSHQFKSEMAIGCVITDYYFPNAGVRMGNFNDYDDEDGAGAHTLEAGLTFSGPTAFPIGLSTYVNVYNDGGKNTYFQADYSTAIKNIDLDFFIGAAGGSKKNPDYYGTESFKIINLGFTVNKALKISDCFALPMFVTYVLNPNIEVSYLIFGISL